VLTLLCSFGHIATYAELLARFDGQESAVLPFRRRTGGLIRWLRPNVYVCAHLDEEELAAARVGGRLDCTTVLRRRGVLSGDGCLHLRLRANDGRASARRWAEPTRVVAHWRPPRWDVPSLAATRHAARPAVPQSGGPLSRLELPLNEALRQALISCLTPAASLAALATLLEDGTSPAQLADAVRATPRYIQARLQRLGLPGEIAVHLESLR
jgi:hypothetical protein